MQALEDEALALVLLAYRVVAWRLAVVWALVACKHVLQTVPFKYKHDWFGTIPDLPNVAVSNLELRRAFLPLWAQVQVEQAIDDGGECSESATEVTGLLASILAPNLAFAIPAERHSVVVVPAETGNPLL